ncbi:transmembrane protein 64 [Drosophila tropicalis]|uniref:transmembrane protein 64 n=1 Tax=Drosophila tropicalis TaxID=46794 RepID=UPI0035ABC090
MTTGESSSSNTSYRYGNNNIKNSSITTTVPTSDAANAQLISIDLESSDSNADIMDTSSLPPNLDDDSLESDVLLINSNGNRRTPRSTSMTTNTTHSITTSTSSSSTTMNTASSTSSFRGKSRSNSCWMRTYGFITRNWYLGYLVPASLLGALLLIGWLTRDYAKELLFWIETQNPWIIFAIFMALFTLVSFPIIVGYFVLLLTAGYLFGCWRGWLTVILGANLGIAIAHTFIRSCRHRIPLQKLIKNETGRAIMRVISGPKAFKVVFFTRLTPIPFGLQNVIFGISSINTADYHVATLLGLLPAQTINVYLGSTLRSMHEVLNDNETKLTGYISFVFEVICGVCLMFWVIQKARKELADTLLAVDYANANGKPLDIQV